MQKLPIEFTQSGFTMKQIERQETAAIYSQSKNGKVLAYDVVMPVVRPAESMFGRDYPARELYPSSEMWGSRAWTCADLRSARARFKRVLKLKGVPIPNAT